LLSEAPRTNTILNNTVANLSTLSLVNNTGFCP
jgi:hypothetical protein